MRRTLALVGVAAACALGGAAAGSQVSETDWLQAVVPGAAVQSGTTGADTEVTTPPTTLELQRPTCVAFYPCPPPPGTPGFANNLDPHERPAYVDAMSERLWDQFIEAPKAQAESGTDRPSKEGDGPMTDFPLENLWILYSVLIPLAVGVATKYFASSTLKSIVHITGVVALAADKMLIDHDGKVPLDDFVTTTVVTYVVGIAAYLGFLKPTGIAEQVKLLTVDFGLGKTKSTDIDIDPRFAPDGSKPYAVDPDAIPPVDDNPGE